MRDKLNLSQAAMGKKVGKPQSVISRFENDEYDGMTVKSLLDIARGLDVALLIRFVSYPEFLHYASKMSEDELQADTIHDSFTKYESLADSTTDSVYDLPTRDAQKGMRASSKTNMENETFPDGIIPKMWSNGSLNGQQQQYIRGGIN